jgi:hypothetical protein
MVVWYAMAIGDELFCFHCGHKWNKRVDITPKKCPHCTNINWNRQRVRAIYNRRKKKPAEKIEEENIMQEKNVGQPTETSFTQPKTKPKLKFDY